VYFAKIHLHLSNNLLVNYLSAWSIWLKVIWWSRRQALIYIFCSIILAPMGENCIFDITKIASTSHILTWLLPFLIVNRWYNICYFIIWFTSWLLMGRKVLKRRIPIPLNVYSFPSFFHLSSYQFWSVKLGTKFHWGSLISCSTFIGDNFEFYTHAWSLLKGVHYGMWMVLLLLFSMFTRWELC